MKYTMNEIINGSWGFAEAKILNTCFKLKIFDKIYNGDNTLNKLVLSYNYEPDILESILLVLVNKDILSVCRGTYFINNSYIDFLVSTRQRYIGNIWKVHESLNNKMWDNLEKFIVGESLKENLFSFKDNTNWKNILPYLNSLALNTSITISDYFTDDNVKVLDIGCGSAKLLSTLLNNHLKWKGVGIDNPTPIKNASIKYSELIKNNRLKLISQDIFSYNKSIGKFDIVILSNILHGYDTQSIAKLLDLVNNYLNDDGKILVNEFIIDKNSNDIMQYIYNIQFAMTGNGKSFHLDNLNSLFKTINYELKSSINLNAPYNCLLYSKK